MRNATRWAVVGFAVLLGGCATSNRSVLVNPTLQDQERWAEREKIGAADAVADTVDPVNVPSTFTDCEAEYSQRTRATEFASGATYRKRTSASTRCEPVRMRRTGEPLGGGFVRVPRE